MTTGTDPELSDIDLLDDPYKHAKCPECCTAPRGAPFLALCGKRAIGILGIEAVREDVPPGIALCPECMALEDEPCPWCGAEWDDEL